MKLLVLTADDLAIALPDAMPGTEIRTVLDAMDPPTAVVIDIEMADELHGAGLAPDTPVVWCAEEETSGVDLWALIGSRPSEVVYRPVDPEDVARSIRSLTGAVESGPERPAGPGLEGSGSEPGESGPAPTGPVDAEPAPTEVDLTGLELAELELAELELARAGLVGVGDAAGAGEAVGPPEPEAEDGGGSAMDELWLRFRETMLDRLDEVEMVAIRLLDEAAEPAAVRDAHEVAHKLKGSLGTFGLDRGSRLAAELESLLEAQAVGRGTGPDDVLRVMELTVEIRQEVEGRQTVAEPDRARVGPVPGDRPILLLLEPDRSSADALAAAAIARGFRPEVVRDPDAAVERLRSERPAAAIIDFDAGPPSRFGPVMREASLGKPRVPVLVHGRAADTAARAEAARLGAQGFMRWPAETEAMVGFAAQLAEPSVRDRTILVVDDDLDLLERIAGDLRRAGFRVRALDQPLEFWRTLEAVQPDLVILDLDLPGPSGTQLCRMIRADAAWADLPVVLLSRKLDVDGYRRGYRAGADDVIPGPFQSEEVVARINHRLDRSPRAVGELDTRTGLPLEPRFRSLLRQLLVLADRYDEPMTVVRIRVRRVRELSRLVSGLQRHLRPEDLLGVWGAGELAMARWGAAGPLPWLEAWARDETGTVAYTGRAEFPAVRDADALLEEADRQLRWAIEQGPIPGE